MVSENRRSIISVLFLISIDFTHRIMSNYPWKKSFNKEERLPIPDRI